MNKNIERNYVTRPTVTLELPLTKNTRILHPDQVILKINCRYYDVGAFCYSVRSDKRRKNGQPREVALGTFLEHRPRQIRQLIREISRLFIEGGKRVTTVHSYLANFKVFLDRADAQGLHNCLSGGDATLSAFLAWASDTHDLYRKGEIGSITHNYRLRHLREILEMITGVEGLHGNYQVRQRSLNNGTEPLAPHDFAHAVALNQALFDGLCDLVLDQQPFPFKLQLPATLGWEENHLWLFPTGQWRKPPHKWGAEREKSKVPSWAYDYVNGRLATLDEILHLSQPPDQRRKTRKKIANAKATINSANSDARHRVRIMLASIAQSAFLFLFVCNTGANQSVAMQIETSGEIDVATQNQQYRSVKFRANAKDVSIVVPATFMPSLRRFMELRRYLLGPKSSPFLFFTLGVANAKPPMQIPAHTLDSHFINLLRVIDPQLPRIGSRKLRASVADWYQRHHDASITSKVLQNSEQTTQKRYDAGSPTDHREELSLFLNSISESAKRQRVISLKTAGDIPLLEEGGRCESFGHPEALVDHAPVQPNCKDSQGCLFCTHRVLVACEEDARKVASAAFIMEQVILGPKHEEALRPLIVKCDQDLEKISAFGNCSRMVKKIRKDVFENGSLTPYFADKYQLLLELGVIA